MSPAAGPGLNELFAILRDNLTLRSASPPSPPEYDYIRAGDVPHSLAIDKIQRLLGYQPRFNTRQGLDAATQWYYENLACQA